MPADNNLNPGCNRIKIESMDIMQHVYRASAQFDQLCFRQL